MLKALSGIVSYSHMKTIVVHCARSFIYRQDGHELSVMKFVCLSIIHN